MENPINTPILYLVFNRPEFTVKSFNSIRNVKPKKLYIAADGPRIEKPGEFELTESVRRIATQVDWDCEVKLLFNKSNKGCKYAVSSAIDWFFENEEYGIILEDDIIPSKSFFIFCDELLTRYKDDNRIGMISGCNFTADKYSFPHSLEYSNYVHIWGWATWRRAWRLYDVDMQSWKVGEDLRVQLPNLKDNGFLFSKYWGNIFDDVKNKVINTWDYQWMYTMWRFDIMSIVPCVNLIENIGFNTDDATHRTFGIPEYITANPKTEMTFPLDIPFEVAEDQLLDTIESKYVFHISLSNFIVSQTKRFWLVKFFRGLYKLLQHKLCA